MALSLIINGILWTAVIVLGTMAAIRSKPLFFDGARAGVADFVGILPRIIIGIIGSGYLAEALPKDGIADLIGPDTGMVGVTIAAAAGALTPGGPVVGFAIGATMLKGGAGAPQVVAYSIAWALYALPRILNFELPYMPGRVVWLRAAVSLPLPFIAAILAMLLGRPVP